MTLVCRITLLDIMKEEKEQVISNTMKPEMVGFVVYPEFPKQRLYHILPLG